jgi:hypothetical protein
MKIKLALITLLLPAAVFAQSDPGGKAGYQGTISATQGLGGANPNAGANTPGYQGTTNATKGYGATNSNPVVPQNPQGNNPSGVNPQAAKPR